MYIKSHVLPAHSKKLTEQEALEVLTSSEPVGKIAKRLGVNKSRICEIRSHRSWRHLTTKAAELNLMSSAETIDKSISRWKRYSTPSCDGDDIRQEALLAAWRGASRLRSDKHGETSAGYYIANGAANGARKAIISDQRARNPSLGNGERIKSSAFVSTAVHDDAVCGKGTATVEACLESAPRGDVDLAIDLLAAVDKLPERLKSVIMRRYVDGTDQDQRDLAETDGVSRAYIGQLEQKALVRLRKLLA